jgi:hypothetical protein
MADKKDDWMQTLWRPAMGWMYMLICLLDMAVFPVLWSLLQAMTHQPITQWMPLTLQGAGLFHIAMGAVLGIAAFGRTQEKLAGTAANPTSTTQTTTTNTNQSGGFNPGGFNPGGSFGSQPLGGNSMSTAPSFSSAPPAFGASTPPTFGSASPTCPNTGKPLGPAQSFPAL